MGVSWGILWCPGVIRLTRRIVCTEFYTLGELMGSESRMKSKSTADATNHVNQMF